MNAFVIMKNDQPIAVQTESRQRAEFLLESLREADRVQYANSVGLSLIQSIAVAAETKSEREAYEADYNGRHRWHIVEVLNAESCRRCGEPANLPNARSVMLKFNRLCQFCLEDYAD
jgi:formylmethanofuran dehydrogenase subunit E